MMALLHLRVALCLVLGLALLVKAETDSSQNVQDVVNRVSNVAIQENPTEPTPVPVSVDKREIQNSQDVQDVVNRVSNVAIQENPTEPTPVPVSVDNREIQEPSTDTTESSSSKRNAPEESNEVIETNMKGLGRAIHDYVSKRSHSILKRSLDNRTVTWDYNVPIIFNASFDQFYRNIVVRVLRIISDKTCLNLKDETKRWDASNPHWFTQNGYTCDCYIKMVEGYNCNTRVSGPKNGTVIEEIPCHDTEIALHETFHSLGIPHEQQAYSSPKYISVFYNAIRPELRFAYDATSPSIETSNFDATTTMLYVSGTWSSLGDDTYFLIRPDQGQPDEATSGENVVFQELNSRYKCAEKSCSSNLIDCSPGYLTRVQNVCKCVCPPEYNATANCKKLIDHADTTLKWDIPVTLLAGGDTYSCPPGFQATGWFSHCGTWTNRQSPSPAKYPSSGTTTYYPVCSKTSPTAKADWDSLPMGGRYCFIKPKGVHCGGVLTEATIQVQSVCPPESNGTLGDITIDSSNNITIKLCCSNHEALNMEAALPNETPFRLFTIYSCPSIQGMRTYAHTLSFYTKVSGTYAVTSKPRAYSYSSEYVMYMCYFQPPKYGCNQKEKLTPSRKSVTITTPDYPGPRPANTRCIYCFDAPEGSQIKVTFNDYDLHAEDKMRIKRFHQWAAPYRIDNDNPWKQFVTEKSYLCMEFWTGYLTNVTNKGAKFTVDLLLPSDSCYDTSQNGQDYVGTTSVSETYEECLPWKDTLTCDDSSVNAADALTGYYESNYCRNPGGKLLQPWCYVYRNDTSCIKRYCDVCNIKEPVDALKPSDCVDFISKDSTFCKTSVQRFACFKSCGLKQAPAGSVGTCQSPPPIPSDGALVGSAKSSYKAGDRAYARCKYTVETDKSSMLVMCTRNGWRTIKSACLDCPLGWTPYGDRCIYFTTATKTRPAALAYCKSFGRNGTLMHIRSEADQAMIRSIRQQTGSTNDHTWFGAYLCDGGKWCFLDTTEAVTYSNWAHHDTPKNSRYSAVYMYREVSSSDRGGVWTSISSTSSNKNTFFCQVDRAEASAVADAHSTCQSYLTENPMFCKDAKTTNDAAIYCSKSCGISSATPKCSEPSSSTCTRTNGTGPISTGDYMTFECKRGYLQTGGDVSRACGLAGTLLGTAPVCSKNPKRMDMGWELVRQRKSTLDTKLAFVMDQDGYRVPFDGKITAWFYYCNEPGLIYFLVFRKSGSNYKLIGHNTYNCLANWRLSFNVPTANQTSVAADDMVGAWTLSSDTLSVSNCGSAIIKILNIPTAQINDEKGLLSTTSYPTRKCIIPAIGFRVEK